jgi:hypothetical protein
VDWRSGPRLGLPSRSESAGSERRRNREGWLYLAAVQDAYSALIVGWSTTTHMIAETFSATLKIELVNRRAVARRLRISEAPALAESD